MTEDEIFDNVTEAEGQQLMAAYHFADLARKNPDSTWGPLSASKEESDVPEDQMISSAELILQCELQIKTICDQVCFRLAVDRAYSNVA